MSRRGIFGFGSASASAPVPAAVLSQRDKLIGQIGQLKTLGIVDDALEAKFLAANLADPNVDINLLSEVFTSITTKYSGVLKKIDEIAEKQKAEASKLTELKENLATRRGVGGGGKRSKKSRKQRSKKHRKTRRRSA